jgi:hypothetical protein
MKIIRISGLIGLAVLIVATSCKKEKNTSYDRFNLKGKVKILKENIHTTQQIDSVWEPGGILATTEYFFDEDGINIENKHYFGNAELFSGSRFTYDKGVLVREDNSDKNGQPLYTTTFKKISDEETEFERTISTGEIVTRGKNYIQHKRIVKSVFTMYSNSQEKEVITMTNTYNEKGDIGSRTQSNKSGESQTTYFKYTGFDKEGNWTTCVTFGEEGEALPYNYMSREYTYYE